VNVVDQENGYEVYKMESMEDMNVQAGDKVVTNEPTNRTWPKSARASRSARVFRRRRAT
jgi:hypothetical protein